MARGDCPFRVIERIGDNAYKLQLPGDMVVSTTFNVSHLSANVEDCFEDPSNLGQNPLEEGKVDADHTANVQGGEGKFLKSTSILSLFSLNHPELSTTLSNILRDVPKFSYGLILLSWTA